ncbi:carbohydrate binding domain-containing protein [Paenibacillus sp. BJ-4]|uniref:carbohydrate binding domain-containing protein n=1 Tax=Paenibacillus sp. BJ-4 TaxID=2878097 RepID=UPI001CEFE439|nr:carbohydrate binding domain-containing protein [Paenibacillus sp. BJ-4]
MITGMLGSVSVVSPINAGEEPSTSVKLSRHASEDSADGSGASGYDLYRNVSFIKQNITDATYANLSENLNLGVQPGNQAIVYYFKKSRGWSDVNIHYAPDGSSWTSPPGISMNENACLDWSKKTIDLGSKTSMKAAFNNGSVWDNNKGADYHLSAGLSTIRDGVVTTGAENPCSPPVFDLEAPSIPQGLTVKADGLRIQLQWDPSVDNGEEVESAGMRSLVQEGQKAKRSIRRLMLTSKNHY